MAWTTRAYRDDTAEPAPETIRWLVVITTVIFFALFVNPATVLTSLVGASVYWCMESTWNQFRTRTTETERARFVPWSQRHTNPRHGRLSTILQWGLNVLMLPAMMWAATSTANLCGSWAVPAFIMVTFPVALFAMEVVQVAVSRALFGLRPWAKYSGRWAMFNGSIMVSMWPLWSILGLGACFAWPALHNTFQAWLA